MAKTDYKLSKIFFKIIILTYCGHVVTRSIPSRNLRYHNAPSHLPYPLTGSLPVQPIYYNPIPPQVYQHNIAPTGTFYDKKRGILRSFPGGGIPLLVDYQKRCSNNYVGIKPHPNQNQYYYVCKPDCVVFGKCQNLQAFDLSKGQCSSYPQPDYTPICKKPGRFPILADCTIYYRCDTRLRPQIFSCPENTVFSPHDGKCICDTKCSPTIVSPYGTYIPQDCVHKFPPCVQAGTYRTPTDCSLYYSCAIQPNRVYLQTRYRCPELTFYDTSLGVCRPQHEVACDAIQLSELVYPRQPVQSHLPIVYPPYYSMDSLEDNQYPIENSLSCSKEESQSESVASNQDSHSPEDNDEVINSSIEKMYPRLSQHTTELTIPFTTQSPKTIPHPTTTLSTSPTDYTTLNSLVATENPLYTNTHPTDNMVQNYPSTQFTLPPPDHIKYVRLSHHVRPNVIKNTLDETDLRNIRSSATNTATAENFYKRRKGHLNTKDFHNVIDSYKFDYGLPTTATQIPIHYKLTNHGRHATIQVPNKITLADSYKIGIKATTPMSLNEHKDVNRSAHFNETESVAHDMQSNEALDVSYYDDDMELTRVLSSTEKSTPIEGMVLTTQSTNINNIHPTKPSTHLDESQSSADLDDGHLINKEASQLQSPLEADIMNKNEISPPKESTTTNLDDVSVPIAFEEGISSQDRSSSSIEPTPRSLVEETLKTDEVSDIPHVLGQKLPPQEKSASSFETATTNFVIDPETQFVLKNEIAPQERSSDPPPSPVISNMETFDEGSETLPALGEDIFPQEGLSPSIQTTPINSASVMEVPFVFKAPATTDTILVPGEETAPRKEVSPSNDSTPTNFALGEEISPQQKSLPSIEQPHTSQDGLSQFIDPTPVHPAEGNSDVTNPETHLTSREETPPQERSSSSVDPTPTSFVSEKLDVINEGSDISPALGRQMAPQEEASPPTVTQSKGIAKEKSNAIDPETSLVFGEDISPQEGSSPTIDSTPTNLAPEKLDGTDEDLGITMSLGKEITPHERSSPSIETTSTKFVTEPETPFVLRDEITPPEMSSDTPPSSAEALPGKEGSSGAEIPSILGEEIPSILREENVPQIVSSPPIEPTPTSLVSEKFDAETPTVLAKNNVPPNESSAPIEISSILGEEKVPPRGSSPSIEPAPTSLVKENSSGLQSVTSTGSSLFTKVPPSIEPTPTSLVREKLNAETPTVLAKNNVPPNESSAPIEISSILGEEKVPPNESSPSIETAPTSLVREKLDAEIPPVLGQDKVTTKGSSPPIEPTPTSLVREKLDAETPTVLAKNNVPPKESSAPIEISSILGDEKVLPKGSSPSIEPAPTSLVREKLEAEIPPVFGEDKVPTKGSSPPIEPTPTNLVREKLDAESPTVLAKNNVPPNKSSAPIEISSILGEEKVPPNESSPSIETAPTSLVREKLDAEIPPVLGQDKVTTKGSSPPIEPTPTSLVREKLDAETPTALAKNNVPPKESSVPIEISSILGEEKVLPKGSSPSIEPAPTSLVKQNSLGQQSVTSTGSSLVTEVSPSIEPAPTSLVREKLDPEFPAVLNEGKLPTKGSSPLIEPTSKGFVIEKLKVDPIQGSRLESITTDPEEVSLSDGSTGTLAVEHSTIKYGTERYTLAMDIKTSPTTGGSKYKGSSLPGMHQNVITNIEAGWKESQIKDLQTRVVKSVSVTKAPLAVLPNDEAKDFKFQQNSAPAHTILDFEAPLVTEPISAIPTSNEVRIVNMGAGGNRVTDEVLPKTNVESSTKFVEFDDEITEIISSVSLLPKHLVTRESVSEISKNGSFGEVSETPSSMENEISHQHDKQGKLSTKDNWTSAKPVTDKSQNSEKSSGIEHQTEPTESEHTTQLISTDNQLQTLSDISIWEPEDSTAPTQDILDTDMKSSIFRPMQNAAMEQGEIQTQFTVEPVENNGPLGAENTENTSKTQLPLLTRREEESVSNSTTHFSQGSNQVVPNNINVLEVSIPAEPTMAAFVETEDSDRLHELEEEATGSKEKFFHLGVLKGSVIEKPKKSEEVFIMESSTDDVRTEFSSTKSFTDIIKAKNTSNRDKERDTHSELKENIRDKKSDKLRSKNFRSGGPEALMPNFVRGIDPNESKEKEPTFRPDLAENSFSNTIDEITTKTLDESIITTLPLDASLAEEKEQTTESTVRDSNNRINIVPIIQRNSLIDSDMGWGKNQTKDWQVRVVKEATHAPQTNHRNAGIKVNLMMNVEGTTFKSTRDAEIRHDFKQDQETSKRTDQKEASNFIRHQVNRNWNEIAEAVPKVHNVPTTGEDSVGTVDAWTTKYDFRNFAKNPIYSTEFPKFANEAKVSAAALERATGLIRIHDSSNFIKPALLQSANFISNKGNLLLPMQNSFFASIPTTGPTNTKFQDIPITEQAHQTPFEQLSRITTMTIAETTTPDQIPGETTENLETTTAPKPKTGIQLDNPVDFTSDNVRIVRYTKDTTKQCPEAIKRQYRQNPMRNTNSQIVTEIPLNATDIPKMEVVVFGDLDLSVLYCGNECNATHEHKFGKNALGEQHAVGIQWDPVNSNRTMSLVTV
ncbi:titin homolog [Eurosta solidaginis]|uniref:titin homolog n=1 Tax=Eurosta solidaginis TaxID=178769 RepID=UPI003531520E